MFQIKAQKRYQCLHCKGTKDAAPAPWMTDNKGNMDLAFSGRLEDLQAKVTNWADSKCIIEKRCEYQFFRMVNNDEETVPSTPHEEWFKVCKAPQLLWIKLRDRVEGIELTVNVADIVTVKGVNNK